MCMCIVYRLDGLQVTTYNTRVLIFRVRSSCYPFILDN